MKYLLLIMFTYCSTTALAQTAPSGTKGHEIKERVLKAFGGKDVLLGLQQMRYTLVKVDHRNGTSRTHEVYTLDLPNKYITIKEYTGDDTLIKQINADGAWKLQQGKKAPLTDAEVKKMQRVFLTNFIPMLQNEALVYEYIKSLTYKTRTVDVVRVYAPQKQEVILDIFVDRETGKIVTSSRPDPETGSYTYYADETDYQEIGEGVVFPLKFHVLVDGNLVVDGRFEKIVIK